MSRDSSFLAGAAQPPGAQESQEVESEDPGAIVDEELEEFWDGEQDPEDGFDEEWEQDRGFAVPRSHDANPVTLVASIVGWTAILGGLALIVLARSLPGITSVTRWLDSVGAAPIQLLVIGTVLILVESQRRHIKQLSVDHQALVEDLEAKIGDLSASRETSVEGHDFDHLFVALQRQDEKLNNLTRAMKMYGKPIVEISNQVSAIAGNVASFGRFAERLGDVQAKITSAMSHVESNLLAALDGYEINELGDKLQSLLSATYANADSLLNVRTEIIKDVDERWEETRQSLAEALERIGNRGSVESTLESVLREIQGVASSIARLRVGEGAAAPTRPAGPLSAEEPAAEAAKADGLAQSIAGSRTGSGKNVLGAIAKLKSMRS